MLSANMRSMRVEVDLSHMERDTYRLLFDLAQSLTSELNLERLLIKTMERIRTVVHADRCSVFLLDKLNNQLWTIMANGLEGKRLRIPVEQGLVGRVVRTGRVLNIGDAYSDERFSPEIDQKTGYVTQSVLCVPLIKNDGDVLGAVQMLNKSVGVFTRDDERLLGGVSPILTIAVENALMYDKLKKHNLSYNLDHISIPDMERSIL